MNSPSGTSSSVVFHTLSESLVAVRLHKKGMQVKEIAHTLSMGRMPVHNASKWSCDMSLQHLHPGSGAANKVPSVG
jgi:hypothetical protein